MTTKTGITIIGDNRASGALNQVAQSAKGAEGGLSRFAKSTSSTFKTVVGLNQGLALAKKAFRAAELAALGLTQNTGAFDRVAAGVARASSAYDVAADKSGALREASKEIRKVLDQIGSYFRSDAGKKDVNEFFATIVMGGADAIDAFVGMSKAATDFAIHIRRQWAALKGENFVEPLEEDVEQRYGNIVAIAERTAERLRAAAGKGVESTREHYSEEEKAAAKAKEELVKRNYEKWQQILADENKMAAAKLATIEAATQQEIAMKQYVRDATIADAERVSENEERVQAIQAQRFDRALADRLEEISEIADAEERGQRLGAISAQVAAEQKKAAAEGYTERAAELEQQRRETEKESNRAMVQSYRDSLARIADFTRTAVNATVAGVRGVISDIVQNHERAAEIMNDNTLTAVQKLKAIEEQTKSAGQIAVGFFVKLGEALVEHLIQLGVEWAVASIIQSTVSKANGVREILIAANVAAAKAFAAYAWIPVAGLGLGAAAAAKTFAATAGFAAPVLGLNKGGEVPMMPGSEAGKDSVMAMLTPGEVVLPVPFVKQMNRLFGQGGSGAFANGGRVMAGAAAGSGPNIHISMLTPPTGPQLERIVQRSYTPTLERLAARGTYKPSGRDRWTGRRL